MGVIHRPPCQARVHTRRHTSWTLPEGRPDDLLAVLASHAEAELGPLAARVVLPVLWRCGYFGLGVVGLCGQRDKAKEKAFTRSEL